jgi:hypothetical protein
MIGLPAGHRRPARFAHSLHGEKKRAPLDRGRGRHCGLVMRRGCLLVHDPDRGTRGAGETVADHLYEVRPDRSLALIN